MENFADTQIILCNCVFSFSCKRGYNIEQGKNKKATKEKRKYKFLSVNFAKLIDKILYGM